MFAEKQHQQGIQSNAPSYIFIQTSLTLQLISNVIICTKTNEEIKQTFEKVTNCKKEAQSYH